MPQIVCTSNVVEPCSAKRSFNASVKRMDPGQPAKCAQAKLSKPFAISKYIYFACDRTCLPLDSVSCQTI